MRLSTKARLLSFVTALAITGSTATSADDPVFSGPQPGEKLTPFKVVSVYGENAGEEVDPIELTGGKPTLLVFVHKLTRPGIGLTRGLTAYAKSKSKSGAAAGIVWLDDDKAKAEAYLTRAKGSLKFVVPVGVSVDGGEGPGAYGLNRNVELTILVANKNEVTANFALVQPSVTEAPKIAGELAKLIDQPAPSLDDIQKLSSGNMMRRDPNMRRGSQPRARAGATGVQGQLRGMMQKLIANNVTPVDLRNGVQEINEYVVGHKDRQAALGRMSSAVLERGMGSAALQSTLKDWKQKYGPKAETSEGEKSDGKRPAADDSKPESSDR